MNCAIKTNENVEWLLDYAAGRLSGERAALVARHVETCRECARIVEAQKVVWNALSQWQPERVSVDFDRRLYRTIEARPQTWIERVFRPFQPLWRPAIPLAATCLLIVAGVALHAPQASVNGVDSQARVEKIEPEQVERTLDDMQMLRELALTPSEERNISKSM